MSRESEILENVVQLKSEPAIEVENLCKSFKGKKAVDNLSLTVEKGEFFGLLGHNGAGKSTTIDCMLGMKKKDGGVCRILGMQAETSRKQLFEEVGVQLQHASYHDKIKVSELCEETAVLYKHPADYYKLLKQFGLSDMTHHYVSTLSGGERQKLSILLALIPQPQVIFLDELTTGLDTVARREVWKQLIKLKEEGVTVFLTSHYMDEVEALCDKACILQNGQIVAYGTIEEIIAKSPFKRLEEAYLWYMGEENIA